MNDKNGDIYNIVIGIDDKIRSLIDTVKDKRFIYRIILTLERYLNCYVGFRTTVEYHVNNVSYFYMSYKVKAYTQDQIEKPLNKLAEMKFNEIKESCNKQHKDYNKSYLWTIRTLRKLFMMNDKLKHLNINEIFNIMIEKNGKITKTEKLIINYPKTEEPKYIETSFKGGVIRQYLDPYVSNYMLCVDYSQQMNEYNYYYNGLHMFEHYVVAAWKHLDGSKIVDVNGATYLNGLCYVYTASSDINTIKDRAIASILYHIDSSDPDFVKKSGVVEHETLRTISEAYYLRNITRACRSDKTAYKGYYDPNLFAYFSSKPINILIVGDTQIDFNINKLDDYYNLKHKNTPPPKEQTFKYYPVEAFAVHYNDSRHMFKIDLKEAIKKIYNNEIEECLYGIGNKYIIYQNERDLIDEALNGNNKKKNKKGNKLIPYKEGVMFQSVLSPLLFFAKYVDKNTLINYIKTNIFPMSATLFETALINWRFRDAFNGYFKFDDSEIEDDETMFDITENTEEEDYKEPTTKYKNNMRKINYKLIEYNN